MIELLGVGIAAGNGVWLLRRCSLRLDRGKLAVIVASRREEADAILDAIAGRRIPDEGRVWVDRLPLMRRTASRVRARVAEAGPAARFAEPRSVLWNTLVTPGAALPGLLRVPRRSERLAASRALAAVGLSDRAGDTVSQLTPAERLRLSLARGLARRVPCLLLRDVCAVLRPPALGDVLSLATTLARTCNLTVVAAGSPATLTRAHVDRIIAVTDGRVVDGASSSYPDAASRVQAVLR